MSSLHLLLLLVTSLLVQESQNVAVHVSPPQQPQIHLPPDMEPRAPPREKPQLMGDPAPILSPRDEGRSTSRGARFFNFWPFSIEITKGKAGSAHGHSQSHGHHDHPQHGGWGSGPAHYGSYTSWATSGMEGAHWNSHANPYAWYGGQMEMEETKAFDDGEKKGLTDAEILKSKHYRKYLKKKHKKIKKLKKLLKWKRLFQKVIQKHIVFKDKIAPY